MGTSLEILWIGIHLPMQGTWVWSLVLVDFTRYEATRPMYHNYQACALELDSHNDRAHHNDVCPQPLLTATRESLHSNEDPAQLHINKLTNFLKRIGSLKIQKISKNIVRVEHEYLIFVNSRSVVRISFLNCIYIFWSSLIDLARFSISYFQD